MHTKKSNTSIPTPLVTIRTSYPDNLSQMEGKIVWSFTVIPNCWWHHVDFKHFHGCTKIACIMLYVLLIKQSDWSSHNLGTQNNNRIGPWPDSFPMCVWILFWSKTNSIWGHNHTHIYRQLHWVSRQDMRLDWLDYWCTRKKVISCS